MKKNKKRLEANNKNDKMLMLFLSCFNLIDDYTRHKWPSVGMERKRSKKGQNPF